MLVLCGVALRALISHFYAKISRALAQAQQDALASSSGVAEQCLTLIAVVRVYFFQKSATELAVLTSAIGRARLLPGRVEVLLDFHCGRSG